MEGYYMYIANKLDQIRQGPGPKTMLNELKSKQLWRAVLAELIATMLFVFIGTMSAVELTAGSVDISRIAFTFGFMIATLVQIFGHVSGAHMNPAVTIAMVVTMGISPLRGILYVVVQIGGGILGSLILKGMTPSRLHDNLGLTTVNADLNAGQGLGCEIIFTFILVMSIYGVTDPDRPLLGSPAVGIGITIAVIHLAAVPFTGASMNPARSFGSAVVSNDFTDNWIYWVGPIIGGVVAGLAYKYVFSPYRGELSYEEATNKLLRGDDVLVVPKTYFKDEMNGGTTTTFKIQTIAM